MTGRPLSVLAVDDEGPALDDIVRVLRSLERVGEVESVTSGAEALRALSERRFDAVFLDVRMPGLDGLELARVLRRFESPPEVIFVSAYETGAVDAFELRALDYLMKPVSRERIERALARVGEFGDERARASAAAESAAPQGSPARRGDPTDGGAAARVTPPRDDLVSVDAGRGATRLLPRSSILYFEAQGDYVRIVADSGRFLLRARISELERRFAEHGFVRIHRGYVANLARAVEVRPRIGGSAGLVLAGGQEIPIARRKAGELRRVLHA